MYKSPVVAYSSYMTTGQGREVATLIAADPGTFVGMLLELAFGNLWRRVYSGSNV